MINHLRDGERKRGGKSGEGVERWECKRVKELKPDHMAGVHLPEEEGIGGRLQATGAPRLGKAGLGLAR